jgi:6-hydroxycyclohex-1-ene-1-carbonyl-CoA dehydrogenase
MKAAVFYEKGQPLKIEEVQKPSYEKDEVLVKIAACGLCRTDLHYLHGTPTFKKPPIILGHEISGTVEEAGDQVKDFNIGDKVLVPPVFSCGHCRFCREGRGTICSNQIMIGNHRDGGFAEYVSVPANSIFHFPDNVPLNEGCIISDAISSPYHAVVDRAKVRPGDKVAIFGCGGLGLSTVQMASAVGADVLAIDVFEKKLELATKFGASQTLNAKSVENVPKTVRKMTGGGVDIAMEVIGLPATIQQAFDSVRQGGKVVVVGYSHENVTINAGRLMFREIEVMGSLGCPLQDFPKLLDLVKLGKLKVEPMVTHRFKLEQINEGLAILEKGDPDMIRAIVEM